MGDIELETDEGSETPFAEKSVVFKKRVGPPIPKTWVDPGNSERQVEFERYAQTIPVKWREKYLRVCRGIAPLREVVEAKCEECVSYEYVSSRVGRCIITNCPNWAYRPHQGTTAPDEPLD